MGANNTRLSPRQKMINLMYIVLTAMLALNVSSDVLDGFTQVHEGLKRSNTNVSERNTAIYRSIEAFAEEHPKIGRPVLDSATVIRKRTAALYQLVDSFKLAIVHQADGPDGDPNNIVNRDDLEAAAVVMLAPGSLNGKRLRLRVEEYRDFITRGITDRQKAQNVFNSLSTAPIQRQGQLTKQNWEEAKFDQQPVVAAVTLLSKLQNDILYAEGEALTQLAANSHVDVKFNEVHVNHFEAFVIPQSRIVMRGTPYQANIVLAAIDTTARPEIFVGGTRLGPNGLYTVNTGSTGTFTYNGFIQVPHPDGTITKHNFSSSYTVIEPMATVSATMMNVLYAGIDNPISISVPGIPMENISATMTGGSLTRSGDHWVARPTAVGSNAVITVISNTDGRTTNIASSTFRVRKLPDPTAYIAYNDKGNVAHYKGSRPFSKALLLAAPGLEASIDDGLLDVKFRVISFETVVFDSMGNAIPEVSAGASFSPRQKQAFQRLKRGARFFITRIKATGPDGITRDLSPMEIIIGG